MKYLTKKSWLYILKTTFKKFIHSNDKPYKIALGFALGTFLGVLPGSGPIASIFLATIFRLNIPATLLSCLLTNGWFSIITFILSIKIGAAILHLDWYVVYEKWQRFIYFFKWQSLLKVSLYEIILPVIIGYLIISLSFGIFVYLIIYLILFISRRYESKPRINLSR